MKINKIEMTFFENKQYIVFHEKNIAFFTGLKCWDNNFVTGVTLYVDENCV